ncbi:hypothetical protein ACT6QG_04495 [Xanthobacter sp. TB0136]|uniref:hypothetical protein n=1 Tax=Xanthobacter sp. TB0136 TaxID=3459177 RepID=UPI004039AD4C
MTDNTNLWDQPDDAALLGGGATTAPATFPLDERGRTLEAARAAAFPSLAPVETGLAGGTREAELAKASNNFADVETGSPDPVEAPEIISPAPSIIYAEDCPDVDVVPLRHPFQVGERWVREIRIPPPTLGLLIGLGGGMVGNLLAVAESMTGEDTFVLTALRGGDEERVLQAVRRKLPRRARRLLDEVS